jgi:hypothetical protein
MLGTRETVKRAWVPAPARRDGGYALLAVLVVCALAMLATGVALSLTAQMVETVRVDDRTLGADSAARAGLAAAADALCWQGHRAAGSSLSGRLAADQSYDVHIASVAAAGQAGEQSYSVRATGVSGPARRVLEALFEVRPYGLPAGLAAAGDCVLEATVTVAGMGLYCGGDIRGREHLVFAPDFTGAGGDLMYPDIWPRAGAHAVGAIYGAGGEEHASGDADGADTDCHVGVAPPPKVLVLPGPAELAELRGHAVAPGAALEGDTLHLDRLPALSAAAVGGSGIVVVVPAAGRGGPLHIVGSRLPPPQCCPLTLVVEGDADAGDATSEVAFSGALVATGELRVVAPIAVEGSIAAARLTVAAPCTVTAPPWWTTSPPPGYASCALKALA